MGELWERKTGPLGLPVLGKGRDVGGDVETVWVSAKGEATDEMLLTLRWGRDRSRRPGRV